MSVLAVLGAMTARAAATDWSPPIGIPSPSFGIFETAPESPNPWTAGTPGFYYVDATEAGSTDSSNTYGTPAKPRRTIPTVLPAGSVVELHGTYDFSHGSPNTIVSSGTAASPVFVRGVSPTSRPLVRRGWEVKGSYLIVENIEFGPLPDQSATGSVVIRLPASHVVLRNSEVHGTKYDGGIGVVNWEVPYGVVYTGSGVIDNVVIFNNTIHDNGDVNANFDQDVHGIAVSDHVNHLWVVDNQMYRNSGDGIQINAGAGQGATTHDIYVGRNVSHDNKQSGFWVKQATDVILSQNETYGHRPGNSSLGQCLGAQYAPDWVWWIFNHVHDCEYGVTQMSDNQEFSHTFVIGNIIENIHRSTSTTDPGDAWGPSAIMMSGGYERHIVNNTIYNVDSGVNIATPTGSLDIADNIIANVTLSRASHVILGFGALAANATLHHDLLSGDPRLDWGNGQVHLSASQLAIVAAVSGDPQFIDAARGDFHIAATSPAANNGELNKAYGTFQERYGLSIAADADGNVRPPLATTDIGAYVVGGTPRPKVPTPTVPAPPPATPTVPTCLPASIPSAPTGLTLLSQGGGSVKVSWTKPGACGVPTGYVLEGGVAPGDPGLEVELDALTTTYQGGMQPGTFYMRVKARNASGVSPASNEIEVGGVPGAPSRLRASVSGQMLTLNWDLPTTGGTPSGFVVEMGSAPGLKESSGTFPGTTTSASGVMPQTTSYFRVKAVSVAGTSEPSNEVIVTVK